MSYLLLLNLMGFKCQISLNSEVVILQVKQWDLFRPFVLLWWFSVGCLLNICMLSCISICRTVLYHYSLAFKILKQQCTVVSPYPASDSAPSCMFGFGFNSPFTTLDNIQMFAGCRLFTVIDGGRGAAGVLPTRGVGSWNG